MIYKPRSQIFLSDTLSKKNKNPTKYFQVTQSFLFRFGDRPLIKISGKRYKSLFSKAIKKQQINPYLAIKSCHICCNSEISKRNVGIDILAK